MRKAILVVVGIGIAAFTLSGCAPATSSGAGSVGSSPGASSAAGGGSSSGSGPTGKVAVCSAFPEASLSSASGKSFSGTLEADSDGVYGCAYQSSGDTWDWIVAVRVPSDGDDPTTDGMDLGGPSAVKPVSGTGYTTIASKAGVELQDGKDVIEVYTPSSASTAQATTAQFVAVAKAVIAAVNK
jgi:predicted small secreted protein